MMLHHSRVWSQVDISSSEIQQMLSACNFFMWSFSKSRKNSNAAQFECQCSTVMSEIPWILQRKKRIPGDVPCTPVHCVFACICALPSLSMHTCHFPFCFDQEIIKSAVQCNYWLLLFSHQSSFLLYLCFPSSFPSFLTLFLCEQLYIDMWKIKKMRKSLTVTLLLSTILYPDPSNVWFGEELFLFFLLNIYFK